MKDYSEALEILMDKVEGSIEDSWGDIVDELELEFHPDSLRKAFAVTPFSGYEVAKYYQKLLEEGLSDSDLNKLEEKSLELAKERYKLQDARREYNKNVRAEARYEALKEVLEEKLNDIEFDDIYSYGELVKESLDKKSAILCLADWHVGALVDSQWNHYDVEEAQHRVDILERKVKQYIVDHRITDLAVEINGDMIEGQINISNKCASEIDTTEQIVLVSKMLSKLINSFKPYVQSIKVITTLGNHGRLTPNKKEQSAEKENFEMLIPEFLRLMLDKDITIITSQGIDIVKYEFDDKVIGLAHGHHDKPNKAIDNFVSLYKVVPNEIHLGHYHSASDTNDSNMYINVTGSLKGSDDYALGAVRKTTKPSQNLIIYGTDRMVVEIICE